jgi:putative cell wall-binding protein
VTIIGGANDVSAETEAELRATGATVQRIAGTVAEVTAALAARIGSGRAFG